MVRVNGGYVLAQGSWADDARGNSKVMCRRCSVMVRVSLFFALFVVGWQRKLPGNGFASRLCVCLFRQCDR